MKSSYGYVASVAAMLVLSATADAGPRISVDLDGVKMFGHTIYIVPEYRETSYLERELQFPLNPFMARLNVGVEGEFSGGTPWRLLLDISRNVNDPGSPMKDTGWFVGDEETRTEKYLYTESDAELGAWFIDINGRLVFCRHHRFRLEGILGFGYRKLSYETFGEEGWVYDPSMEYSAYEGENVIDYDITYYVPYAGVGTRVQPSPAWAIDAELSYSPRTLAKDHDDHIKRFKTSEADCTGRTIKSTLGVNWAPRREGDGLRWFVGVGAEIIHTTTDGHQVQSWYGDDPYTEEDDTGTRSPSIKTEIKSTCGSVCMRFGIEL